MSLSNLLSLIRTLGIILSPLLLIVRRIFISIWIRVGLIRCTFFITGKAIAISIGASPRRFSRRRRIRLFRWFSSIDALNKIRFLLIIIDCINDVLGRNGIISLKFLYCKGIQIWIVLSNSNKKLFFDHVSTDLSR